MSGADYNQALGHCLMTAKSLFNFKDFHPNAVPFDLTIFAAHELHTAIRTVTSLISSAVNDIGCIRIQGILNKALGCKFRIKIISFGPKRCFDVNVAFFANVTQPVVFQDQYRSIGYRQT